MLKKIGFYLGVGLGHLLVLLPYCLQLKLGAFLGYLTFWLMPKRRHIVRVNLALCFPEKTAIERETLCRQSFKSLGRAAIESVSAWLMSDRRFAQIPFKWSGKENYDAALACGQGVIFLSAHMDCLELFCRQFGWRVPNGGLVYKKSRNPLFDKLLLRSRMRFAQFLVAHENMRGMVKALRQKKILWYAPDQDFGRVRSVFAPFFHAKAATIVATSVLADLGQARVMPVMMHRLPEGGCHVHTYPLLANFPSGDELADATRINALIADYVRQYPEQYIWMHRRFKTRPEGEPSVY